VVGFLLERERKNMEPITAVLTGIALVKQSVEFIKSNIETVKDIGEIVGAIDNLLDGEKQVQKERFSGGKYYFLA
jgi:hypothetical protein